MERADVERLDIRRPFFSTERTQKMARLLYSFTRDMASATVAYLRAGPAELRRRRTFVGGLASEGVGSARWIMLYTLLHLCLICGHGMLEAPEHESGDCTDVTERLVRVLLARNNNVEHRN